MLFLNLKKLLENLNQEYYKNNYFYNKTTDTFVGGFYLL